MRGRSREQGKGWSLTSVTVGGKVYDVEDGNEEKEGVLNCVEEVGFGSFRM